MKGCKNDKGYVKFAVSSRDLNDKFKFGAPTMTYFARRDSEDVVSCLPEYWMDRCFKTVQMIAFSQVMRYESRCEFLDWIQNVVHGSGNHPFHLGMFLDSSVERAGLQDPKNPEIKIAAVTLFGDAVDLKQPEEHEGLYDRRDVLSDGS